jgi:hypothetical protein
MRRLDQHELKTTLCRNWRQHAPTPHATRADDGTREAEQKALVSLVTAGLALRPFSRRIDIAQPHFGGD